MSTEAKTAHGHKTDPYRVFFPLGILLGLAGVSVWPFYYFGVTEGYSGRAHAFVQICGFLYSFAAGFLLTAVPRFTGTEAPSRKVQYFLMTLIVLSVCGFETGTFTLAHAAFLAAHISLIVLAARRFLHRKQNPPATFPLVGVGLAAGAMAALLNVAIAFEFLAPSWDPLGKRLLTEGMFLMLVLGVGGFLGPRLMGFAALPQPGTPLLAAGSQGFAYAGAGFVLLLSLFAEYGLEFGPAAFLTAGLTTAIVAVTVRPWQLPAVRTTLAWCVWTANLLVIFGIWLAAFARAYRADFLHVLFIAFTLLILAVGTRVTLSHGGHPLAREKNSWPLRIGFATAVVAMFARLGAPFAPETYFDHLAWAAVLWIAGMLFWGFYIVRLLKKAN
jgi:uncharacterized protein involved in response to NO